MNISTAISGNTPLLVVVLPSILLLLFMVITFVVIRYFTRLNNKLKKMNKNIEELMKKVFK
ncbi:MAG: hypothetical protein SCL54_07655 [Bacillota bacterium]|nr:hypothetical protein [Bacillota bacterium]